MYNRNIRTRVVRLHLTVVIGTTDPAAPGGPSMGVRAVSAAASVAVARGGAAVR